MSKLKRLSGKEVVRIFHHIGFETVDQRGSHIKLRRIAPNGSRQTLTVPDHAEMDTGTLRAIYRQALRYVPEGELHPHFYAE